MCMRTDSSAIEWEYSISISRIQTQYYVHADGQLCYRMGRPEHLTGWPAYTRHHMSSLVVVVIVILNFFLFFCIFLFLYFFSIFYSCLYLPPHYTASRHLSLLSSSWWFYIKLVHRRHYAHHKSVCNVWYPAQIAGLIWIQIVLPRRLFYSHHLPSTSALLQINFIQRTKEGARVKFIWNRKKLNLIPPIQYPP